MKANAVDALGPAGKLSRRGQEISAAVLLLLYIVAIVVSLNARLSAIGDMWIRVPIVLQGEELLVFTSSAGRNWQFIQYEATLASSMLIVAAAAIVFRVFSDYEPTLALIGSFMMVGAALFAGLFAIAGLILAQGYIGPVVVQDDMEQIFGSRELYDVFVPILILSEKIWLTFAALGGIAYGALIAWTRAMPRWLGWVGIAAALLLLLIWVESIGLMKMDWQRLSLVWIPTNNHMGLWGGSACLIWLLLSAVRLMIKGTDIPTTEIRASKRENIDA